MRHHEVKPFIHLLRCCRQLPTSVDKKAGEAVAGLLLSAHVNHRDRMENGSSKNKTHALVYARVCNQQAPACV